MTFDPSRERLGYRTNSIQEWRDFKKSTIWLDLQDHIESEMEGLYKFMEDDEVDQEAFKVARGIIKFCRYFLTTPDQCIEEIENEKLEKKQDKSPENILEGFNLNNLKIDSSIDQ